MHVHWMKTKDKFLSKHIVQTDTDNQNVHHPLSRLNQFPQPSKNVESSINSRKTQLKTQTHIHVLTNLKQLKRQWQSCSVGAVQLQIYLVWFNAFSANLSSVILSQSLWVWPTTNPSSRRRSCSFFSSRSAQRTCAAKDIPYQYPANRKPRETPS